MDNLYLHIHNDIEDAAKWYKIPMAMYNSNSVYVMQEDRCVFVGHIKIVEDWINRNKNKFCKSVFPLK